MLPQATVKGREIKSFYRLRVESFSQGILAGLSSGLSITIYGMEHVNSLGGSGKIVISR